MYKFKVIKLLKGLKETEVKTFEKFLQTVPFKMQANCLKLYRILIQYYPDFDSPKLDQEKIYYRVFPKNTKYHAGNLRTLASILGKRIQRYLLLTELDLQEDRQHLLLLDAYSKRGINLDLIEETSNQLLQTDRPISSAYYFSRFLCYWRLYELESNHLFDQRQAYFKELNHNLDLFFSLTKIKLGIENAQLNKENKDQNFIQFIPVIQSFLRKNATHIPPALLLYGELYDLNHKVSTNRFAAIFNLLKEKIQFLSKEEALEILTLLFNYANAQTRKKQHKDIGTYQIYRFKLFQFGVLQRLYFKNNVFSNRHFFSIATSAAAVNEFEWTENFIQTYQDFLPAATKSLDIASTKGVYYYLKASSTANLAYYQKSIEALESIKTRNPLYTKRKKLYLLKVYYEYFIKAHHENIIRYFDNVSNYVSRAKYFNEQEKKRLKTDISDLKFLFKARNQPNLSIQELHDKIAQIRSNQHFFKDWMQEMIEEFMQYKTPLSTSL